MYTLLINTVSRRTQIGLWGSEGNLLEIRAWDGFLHEADGLLPHVQQLLSDFRLGLSDIRRLLGVVGPGGFTSSRIGISALNALAYALDIPSCGISLFDLYAFDRWIFFSANVREAWVREPFGIPRFVTIDELCLPDSFQYSGEVSDEWGLFLSSKGGVAIQDAVVPLDISELKFKKALLLPWYYKEASITWSRKNAPSSQNMVVPTITKLK